MGKTSTRSSTPDLFAPAAARQDPPITTPLSSSTTNHASATTTSSRHVLPADLPNVIKQLGDQELERLLSEVLAEQKRRGKKHVDLDESPFKRRAEVVAVPLTQGKLNAVRAAFKAGVTPSRIARQFGISQSDVRKALASDAKR
jgi:hypothetical protein